MDLCWAIKRLLSMKNKIKMGIFRFFRWFSKIKNIEER